MKNLVYAMGLLPLLMSAGAEAQSHARASATGAVSIKGIELSIEEQVRESFADIQPGTMPSHADWIVNGIVQILCDWGGCKKHYRIRRND